MAKNFDELFEDLFSVFDSDIFTARSRRRVLGKSDADGNLSFSLDVPGIPPEALSVEIHEGILAVEGQHEGRKVRKHYTVGGRWSTEDVTAKYAYGVLTLTLGASPDRKPTKIPVTTI